MATKAVGVVCGSDGAVVVIRNKMVSWLSAVDGVDAIVSAALAQQSGDLTQVSTFATNKA